jgi:Tol biopolymer transport system component
VLPARFPDGCYFGGVLGGGNHDRGRARLGLIQSLPFAQRTRLTALAAAVAVACGIAATPVAATFPGSNGKLTFTKTAGPSQDIWLMEPDGQNQTPLTTDLTTDQFASSFSADGESVTYAARLPSGKMGVVISGLDGGNPTLVTDNGGDFPSPHFSPSGDQIVYQAGLGVNPDIAIIDVDGQNGRLLTSGSGRDFEPSFSPDGRRIVFMRYDGTSIDIWTMDADGQNQTQLSTGSPDESNPSFSPDGGRILFVQAPPGDQPGDIAVMDSNGQNRQPLTSTPTVFDNGPVFSPDGTRIAFAQSPSAGGTDSEIVVMDADGQNQVPVTQNADFDNQPDWQPLNPPSCSLSGDSRSKKLREITLTLLCANENAAATASGEMTVKKRRKRGAAASNRKVVPIEPVGVQLQRAVPAALTLSIPKKARKAIKRSGKAGKATITVTVTDDLGEAATLTHAVKVKPKKKKNGRG